ncbi:MAG TPA: helix-turn-helix transcriptional regulator [Pseudonocardiaceae bacterium]|jgi:transcriptional regulator with XRE-family HTH domain|nr:helix-turn-helix transcriptional regulator [Pseudonocardiaceae bacterium]
MTSSEIGRRLRQFRHTRGWSLQVVADRAGISKSHLANLEAGRRTLDSRGLAAGLAGALEVAPTDITGVPREFLRQPVDDRSLIEVRQALLAISLAEPLGEIQPADQLRARVGELLETQNAADSTTVGTRLPALIRDLHTTLAAHRDERDVLRLLALTHMQGTQAWLAAIGAPIDLSWQAATLARQAAEQLDEPIALGIGAYGTALGLLAAGSFDTAARVLAGAQLAPTTVEDTQLAGSLALAASLVSAARKDQAGRAAALDYAAELAARTGETNLMGFGFGPSNVSVWRVQGALETGEYAEAAQIAETVNPAALTVRAREAVYWREYGRSLAHLPKQRDVAVWMLRRAEEISPDHVHRHPFTRDTLSELLARAKRDTAGRELRGMAYRAGLLV